MPRCRSNTLYKPKNTHLSCRARTHCNDCTVVNVGGLPKKCGNNVQIFNIDDRFKDDDDKFIINLDCCTNNEHCNSACCSAHCCGCDNIRPKICKDGQPYCDGSLPRLTKCEIKQKRQRQHNLTLINPCQIPLSCELCRSSLKVYNKKYSFNDQLLHLKSDAYDRSVYNCATNTCF
jgi:hypothetical protein